MCSIDLVALHTWHIWWCLLLDIQIHPFYAVHRSIQDCLTLGQKVDLLRFVQMVASSFVQWEIASLVIGRFLSIVGQGFLSLCLWPCQARQSSRPSSASSSSLSLASTGRAAPLAHHPSHPLPPHGYWLIALPSTINPHVPLEGGTSSLSLLCAPAASQPYHVITP